MLQSPDLFLGGVTLERLLELPGAALFAEPWRRALQAFLLVAGLAAFLASSVALRERLGALDPTGGGEIGRDPGLWAGLFGGAALASLWPVDPWALTLLALGGAGCALGPAALCPPPPGGPGSRPPRASSASWCSPRFAAVQLRGAGGALLGRRGRLPGAGGRARRGARALARSRASGVTGGRAARHPDARRLPRDHRGRPRRGLPPQRHAAAAPGGARREQDRRWACSSRRAAWSRCCCARSSAAGSTATASGP